MRKQLAFITLAALLAMGCSGSRPKTTSEAPVTQFGTGPAPAPPVPPAASVPPTPAPVKAGFASTKRGTAASQNRKVTVRAGVQKHKRGIKEVVVETAKATGSAAKTGMQKTGSGVKWLGGKVVSGTKSAFTRGRSRDEQVAIAK